MLTAETAQNALCSTRRDTRLTTRIMLDACVYCKAPSQRAHHVQDPDPCLYIKMSPAQDHKITRSKHITRSKQKLVEQRYGGIIDRMIRLSEGGGPTFPSRR